MNDKVVGVIAGGVVAIVAIVACVVFYAVIYATAFFAGKGLIAAGVCGG